MKIKASAPSNIALIKYMGKTSSQSNYPANASLSYTLEHLRTFVELEPADQDHWSLLKGSYELNLSEHGKNKFLKHFLRLKELWSIKGHYQIASCNNFPSDCGLASSASSFAALTLAAYELAKSQHPALNQSPEELSRLSRLGSGSSCRSFFSPWALWKLEGAQPLNIDLRLEHAVVLCAANKKKVSSSEAHERVISSSLFQGRQERAEKRLNDLSESLLTNWENAFSICWAEFWDMHGLFETSQKPFGYMVPDTLKFLNHIRRFWEETKDGPLVTMDAGANVHLLFRSEQKRLLSEWLNGFPAISSLDKNLNKSE